ncbi:hypothetical protein [Parasitella parasitica]|uniref:Uncharacterized protein n=1 Tax=Parasitella parasitica TaxID=35722 RepID=A0A0B7N2J0_9FUNG|nr:hypothetical protein [Parasitella parasitica]
MASYLAIASMIGTQPKSVFVDIVIDELKFAISLLASKPSKDTLLWLLQLVLWDTKPYGQECHVSQGPQADGYYIWLILKLEEGVECLRFLNWSTLTLLCATLGNEIVSTWFPICTFNTPEVDIHTSDHNFSIILPAKIWSC